MVTKTKPKKETKPLEMIRAIKLEDLLPNPYQPETRIEVDPETAKKFAHSIWEHGLIQTPVVRPGKEAGKYEVGDGWLRRSGYLFNLEEFGLQDYAKMPCLVKELTDQQMADMVMEANTVRKDLNPIELAKFYKRYLEDFKMLQAKLAKKHNCSQGEIANTMRLLDLPAAIQQKIISQEITETHGRQLLRMNYNTELQHKTLEECIKQGSSVNQLSDTIARTIYYQSNNLDPADYPKPGFDTKECEECPNRQKIGQPYSSDKKTWRCLDAACFKKKTDQAEKEKVEAMQAEIAEAKKEAGDNKKDGGVLDLSNLGWRDYQELGRGYHKLDNPKECETCPRRALGKFPNERTETVCVDVKCFKAKEKAYQDKEAARVREEEKKLTERVKAACDNRRDEPPPFKLIADYLLSHSRKDTREKFARMYGIPDPAGYFAAGDEVNTGQKIAALVLELERYEGERGMFWKMLADLEGTGAELDKQIAAFREKHCKTCRHDKGGCKTLMRVYPEGKCYAYWKKDEDEPEDPGEVDTLADLGEVPEADNELTGSEEAAANPTDEAIDADSAEAEAQEPMREVIASDELWPQIDASYSADRISMKKPVRAIFLYEGANWLCTGRMSDPVEGEEEADCYRIVPIEYAAKVAGNKLEEEGFFYHGQLVIYKKQEYVLIGPKVVFKRYIGEQEETVKPNCYKAFSFCVYPDCDKCPRTQPPTKISRKNQEEIESKFIECVKCSPDKTRHCVFCGRLCEDKDGNYIPYPQPEDPLADLLIQTATDGQKEHRMQLGDIEVRGETLKDCALVLGKHMNWGISVNHILQTLHGLPPSNNTRMLIGILEDKQ